MEIEESYYMLKNHKCHQLHMHTIYMEKSKTYTKTRDYTPYKIVVSNESMKNWSEE